MNAYILSRVHGTIQIGRTVYHLPTKERFNTRRQPKSSLAAYTVFDNSWQSAKSAHRQDVKHLKTI